MLSGWTRHEIAGKPADVFDPGPGALPFALIWLHDESGDTPATDPTVTTQLDAHRLGCVAPHGGRSWWVDRVCPEFDGELTAERFVREHVLCGVITKRKPGPRAVA